MTRPCHTRQVCREGGQEGEGGERGGGGAGGNGHADAKSDKAKAANAKVGAGKEEGGVGKGEVGKKGGEEAGSAHRQRLNAFLFLRELFEMSKPLQMSHQMALFRALSTVSFSIFVGLF